VERAARYGRALSLVLCDIDLFKSVNDMHGHVCGDQVLRQFGRRGLATRAGENPLIMTQPIARAERLRTRAASVHMVMHKFCG